MSPNATPQESRPTRLSAGLTRRLVRRELHHSRSTAVVVALVLVIVAAGYLGTETVLAMIARPALLLNPDAMVGAVSRTAAWSVPAAIALAVLGLMAIVSALTSGRRSRHRLADDRIAVVVDDDVLAGALSRRVATAGSVARDQARTEVAPRSAVVRVVPNSGFSINPEIVSAAARDAAAELAPIPRLRTRVVVAESGVLS
ncbi:MAG: hypothetical protein M3N46_03820 [Actinomycetota bacterium]|nr:hypothetical protein [Actinomycetota bacterium]